MSFIFYFFYLISAQFPLFLLLIIRNFNGNYILYVWMLMFSSLTLYLLNLFFYKRLISASKLESSLKITSSNLAYSTMTEFLSFFLLPFFTFNLSQNTSVELQIIELVFLFLLLSIFLQRSKNLLINPFLFLFFNLYKSESLGANLTVLTYKKRSASSIDIVNKDHFIKLTNSIVLFFYNQEELKKIKKYTKVNQLLFGLFTIVCLLKVLHYIF